MAVVPLFAFADVGVRREDRWILRDVDLTIPEGGITVIVGPSGSGKTSLLRLCNRLDVPDEGTVAFRGADIASLDPLRLRRRAGMVFQRPALFPGTVLDNLRVAEPHVSADEAREVLRRVALDPSILTQEAATLSGGEAQRACLARTLITSPEVLLLDEPTSALDAAPREAFERLVRGLVEQGTSAVWVTHDLDQMRRVADGVAVVSDGGVPFVGTLPELAAAPEVLSRLEGSSGEEVAADDG